MFGRAWYGARSIVESPISTKCQSGRLSGNLGQQVQVDPIADQPEKAQPRMGNAGNVGRRGQVVGDRLRKMLVVYAVRHQNRVGIERRLASWSAIDVVTTKSALRHRSSSSRRTCSRS